MKKNNYIYYKDYLKKRKIENEIIFLSKTNNSYLIGPLIDVRFDENSFYKRIKSNSIYSTKIHKKILKRKSLFLIKKYKDCLNSNEVLEIFKNSTLIVHKIIKVPGDINEKK